MKSKKKKTEPKSHPYPQWEGIICWWGKNLNFSGMPNLTNAELERILRGMESDGLFDSIQSSEFRGNPLLTSLSAVEQLDKLGSLYVTGCDGLTDISTIRCNPDSLETLWIKNCRNIGNFQALARYHRTKSFELEDVPGVKDIEFLSGWKDLSDCRLFRLPALKDLSPAGHLKNAILMGVRECPLIDDLTPASKMPKLRTISITGTSVKSVLPLGSRKSLHLSARGMFRTQIPIQELTELEKTVPYLTVDL